MLNSVVAEQLMSSALVYLTLILMACASVQTNDAAQQAEEKKL